MENSRIIELMAKKVGKCASPAELEELTVLLGGQPGYAYFHEVLCSLKGNQDHLELVTPREELVDHGWEHLSGKLGQDRDRRGILRGMNKRRLWMAAACIAAILVTGGLVYERNVHKEAMLVPGTAIMLEATAGYGSTNRLLLPDGTKVWLNAGSKLCYPQVFSGGHRVVELEGEAYFDVAKDVKAPFSVHAGRITVGVLGTVFNVKAYSDDPEIETSLISGKVQVTLDNEPEKSIMLSPHEKLTVMREEIPANAQDDAAKQVVLLKRSYSALRYQVRYLPYDSSKIIETAWVSNKIVINDESFESVAHALERKYDIRIHFGDERLKDEHISGVFEKEAIGDILQILKMTTGFNYRMEGREVYIWNKQ